MNWETQDPILFFVIVIMPLLLPYICNSIEAWWTKTGWFSGINTINTSPAHPIMKKNESETQIPLSSGDSVFEWGLKLGQYLQKVQVIINIRTLFIGIFFTSSYWCSSEHLSNRTLILAIRVSTVLQQLWSCEHHACVLSHPFFDGTSFHTDRKLNTLGE